MIYYLESYSILQMRNSLFCLNWSIFEWNDIIITWKENVIQIRKRYEYWYSDKFIVFSWLQVQQTKMQ